MHRLAAIPGGWSPGQSGVIFVEQTPAPLVLVTAADTDIQVLAQALPQLPPEFPALRVANLLQLQQQLTIDTYADDVLESAQVIVLRLLGGRAYWSYGLEVVKATVERTGAALLVLPGDDRPDPDLISHSTVPLTVVHQFWRYLSEGGVDNTCNALKYLANLCLGNDYRLASPQAVPRLGEYAWAAASSMPTGSMPTEIAQVGILFYRAHYLAGNTKPIDALCQAIAERGLTPLPIFVQSLQDPEVQSDLKQLVQARAVQLFLNATSFSLAKLSEAIPNLDLWQQLDVSVIQVILSGSGIAQWQSEWQGLSPRDMAMNVALPEVDGRIISRAISFKQAQTHHPLLETDVVGYQPIDDRVAFVADLAANWVKLRQTPPADRRIALVLANYPTRDGRLANGVGLDTPASCVEILKALQQAGYDLGDQPLPTTGDDLIQLLTTGITNDPEGWELRPVHQSLSLTEYQTYFASLPAPVQQGIRDRWGPPEQQVQAGVFPIAGWQFGNVLIGVQPARGYDLDPSLNYHAPDLEPPHRYLAFYHWLRANFAAQAIVHVGKHGNLEWLPGKSIALSENCYPEVALGPLPHLYPFIVNDPGEGSQAKRRSQAVIIDHLTPPLTRAELYGPLETLEALIDEYYQAESLDPSRLGLIRTQIQTLIDQEHLDQELMTSRQRANLLTTDPWQAFLNQADGYLCELKEAQIRDGLHILGQCPQGRQLRDLLVALARQPGLGQLGLTRALAQDWGLEFDPLTADPAELLSEGEQKLLRSEPARIVGDAIALLEQQAAVLVEQVMAGAKLDSKSLAQLSERPLNPPKLGDFSSGSPVRLSALRLELRLPRASADGSKAHVEAQNWGVRGADDLGAATMQVLAWIGDRLLPALQQTDQELSNLLRGLDGRYVPSGPSGAPTRGRPDVLPTGRNFYSVDLRAIPTESAWHVGRQAAEAVVERYSQENGEYPRSLGLSVWGTATMRTGGDDLAEALALLGVQPVWEGASRRVIDFEVLPLAILGRPRVDVTLRISGFFRDAFPNLIDLFDQAVAAVAQLAEPPDQNPLAAQVLAETQRWQGEGLSEAEAIAQSRYRIFGSQPGAYGAGLQGLMAAQNWTSDADLAQAYINWSSYAYTGQADSHTAPAAFEQRLSQMQIVLHNQDNREHDLLDSDDYYQFQGGLTAAVRNRQGQNPTTYFGDNACPENPQVRQLSEEIARVYRSRVINPKWIAGMMRHGYKGAFELAATVDFLFGYDATANCVADHMYEGIAAAYLFDPAVQAFVQQKNPWALRDMAERLLEAHQRGLWQQVNPSTLDELRSLVHQAEGAIEANS
ncbi:MAG: cobaltochelatase subunit CobN [Aphanocapsa sp. GSE-SYN-MK-11-07L]|jgi:cobaltochelatase CobN|nr:cobaltochelatase subunit CobN [Aphanocapsa sp. GSE-SYN-MK-11-07L]